MHLQKLLMEMYRCYLLHIKLIKTPEVDAVLCCKLAMTKSQDHLESKFSQMIFRKDSSMPEKQDQTILHTRNL